MEIRKIAINSGLEWIAGGFRLFRMNPTVWIMILIILLIINALLTIIPLLGAPLLNLLQPILVAGLLGGCRDLERGRELRIEHLFDGFRSRTHSLAIIGAVILVGYVVIGVLSGLVLRLGGLGLGMIGYTASILVATLALPIAMAAFFAPALIWFQDRSPADAMQASFLACWQNFPAFILYGFVTVVLMAVASIPFGLGLLILGPTLIGSAYVAYQEMFEPAARNPR